MTNLYLMTAPAKEPVTLDAARGACHVDGPDDDLFLEGLIVGARQWAEAYTGRAYVDQTWELHLAGFPPCMIELPKPPLHALTSIKYLDTAGALQTLPTNQYTVTAPTGDFATRGRVMPAYSVIFPSTRPAPDAVRLLFVAGYGDAGAVPRGICNAILLHVAESFANRERPDYRAAEAAAWPWVEVRFD